MQSHNALGKASKGFKFGMKGWLLSVFSVLLFSAPIFAEPVASQKGMVLVQGRGQVQVVPDEIRFTVGITANELTAQLAYRQVEERMVQAMRLLKKLGIEDHDIQAVSISLTPVIDYKQRQKVIGHKASRDILVKVNEMQLYARAIESLADIDAVTFSQVHLSASSQSELALLALDKAYQNAESKAQHLAKQSGRKLGVLVEAIEQGANHQPIMAKRYAATAMMSESSGAATVSSGVISVSAQITAKFLIH